MAFVSHPPTPSHATSSPRFPNVATGKMGTPGSPRRWKRGALTTALLMAASAWGIALVYSVTRSSPEPLDSISRKQISRSCARARASLQALPTINGNDEPKTRAQRLRNETEVLAAMVDRFAMIHPPSSDGSLALERWTHDWSLLLRARDRHARGLPDDPDRSFAIPAEQGSKPITVRMNDYATQHGLHACTTDVLQAEITVGSRLYDSY